MAEVDVCLPISLCFGRAVGVAELTSKTQVKDFDDLSFMVIPRVGGSEAWYFKAESALEKADWLERCRYAVELATWWDGLKLGKVLGRGGFTTVYELEDISTKEKLALKRSTAKKRQERDQAIAEADVLIRIATLIRHPNLMEVRKLHVEGDTLSIIFPLCRGKDLYHRIITKGVWSEPMAANLVKKLAGALEALHAHNIVHLDVKPENILFDTEREDAEPLLSDFGLSRVMGCGGSAEALKDARDWDAFSRLRYGLEYDERLNGSIGYMAPEIILSRKYGPAADVWALGVVLYTVLSGTMPFQGENLQEVLERSTRGEFSFPDSKWAGISSGAKQLLRRMLAVDESFRIAMKDIQRHPWVTSQVALVAKLPLESLASTPSTSSTSDPTPLSPSRISLSVDVRGILSSGWSAMVHSPIIRNSIFGRRLVTTPPSEEEHRGRSTDSTSTNQLSALAVS